MGGHHPGYTTTEWYNYHLNKSSRNSGVKRISTSLKNLGTLLGSTWMNTHHDSSHLSPPIAQTRVSPYYAISNDEIYVMMLKPIEYLKTTTS
jgi:hypothetical protein